MVVVLEVLEECRIGEPRQKTVRTIETSGKRLAFVLDQVLPPIAFASS